MQCQYSHTVHNMKITCFLLILMSVVCFCDVRGFYPSFSGNVIYDIDNPAVVPA